MNDYSADVRLAREGDTEAFARLYTTVYEDLYHIALYSLRSPMTLRTPSATPYWTRSAQ